LANWPAEFGKIYRGKLWSLIVTELPRLASRVTLEREDSPGSESWSGDGKAPCPGWIGVVATSMTSS